MVLHDRVVIIRSALVEGGDLPEVVFHPYNTCMDMDTVEHSQSARTYRPLEYYLLVV